ncbi:MAG: alanine--tRNA ligase [Patescibacteria group bacterium]
MTSQKIRRKYIEFFVKKGHIEIPSASLVPENDASTLFVSAGMQPIVPFLMGEKHPGGDKLVNSQKCIRTGDIDEVGDKTHHTFFEMLGHWSLGAYFKKEAIEMSWEFLTEVLNLDKNKLAFSVFEGDENSPRDEEAANTWKSVGVSESRIAYLSKKENWWEPDGTSGPCGPDTEMFYWTDDSTPASDKFDVKDQKWVEIGNDVLMQYTKQGENKYIPAEQKNIDNGTGLERLTAVMNRLDDNYLTDLFEPIIKKIEELSGKKYGDNEEETKSIRIIADHLRAATFIMADNIGIVPSNVDKGYVVRKLIRRAIRHGRMLGIQDNFTHKIGEVVVNLMKDIYSELDKNKEFVISNLQAEEEKFTKTLQQGLKEFEKLVGKNEQISGKDVFNLFQTYGFPIELTQELAKEKNLEVDEKEFELEMQKHQKLSRTASAGKFKGGLANQSEQTIKYHTVAHLMLVALRQVLGDHVEQKGSNINEERLRFDFSHSEKMTDEQKFEVEKLVNEWINQDLEVSCEEMSLEEAKQKNAMGVFEDKYGDKVKIYSVADISCEICGGPHVKKTGVLGKFKIKKEESSSAGVRRIKAVLVDN